MDAPDSIQRSVLALIGAAIALVLASAWLSLTGPSDGARMDFTGNPEPWHVNGVVISPWQTESNGLQEGDLITAVNGQSIESVAKNLASPSRWQPLGRVGETVTYTVIRDGTQIDVSVQLRSFPLRAFLTRSWSLIVALVFFLLIALFVYFKRPGEPASLALLLCALGLFIQLPYFAGLQIGDLLGGVGFWLFRIEETGYLLFSVALLHFWLVFPHPRSLVRNRRWLIPAIYAGAGAIFLLLCFGMWWPSETTLQWIGRTNLVGGILAFVIMGAALIVAFNAYRLAHDPVSRRQVRWVAYAALITVASLVVWAVFQGTTQAERVTWVPPLFFVVPLPVAIAIAILRHQLFDIDVIISRTLLWASLTAFVVGTYVFVVGYLGSLLDLDGNLALSLVATGIVALLFQPLRERVQRLVNNFVYGERDDPYAIVSRLGERLEVTLAPEAVLPTIVETVAQALKLPYAAISLRQGDGLEIAAIYGTAGHSVVNLPLNYQSEPVGELLLSPRSPGDTFSPADRRLLEDLARQVGIAAHAVRLTGEVQRSRERIVTAREEERRRLRRELHDGLGPSLASLTLKLDAARNILPSNPGRVDALLAELKTQTQIAIADVRRVTYDLRPPALDELGLVAALREHAARVASESLQIAIETPDELPPLPAAVEVATYRIALESLTNVVRHAAARTCVIRLSLADVLTVEVIDDGRGISSDSRVGVGLTTMRERAEELGGTLQIDSSQGIGTQITARLPLPTSND